MLRNFMLFLVLFQTIISSPNAQECVLPQGLKDEIASYQGTVQRIIDEATEGNFKGVTYNELAKMVDTFGNRQAGSQNLEDAIDHMLNISTAQGLDNVHGEDIEVKSWARRRDSVAPGTKKCDTQYFGTGSSIGTPPEGIVAEAIIVRSFEELTEKADLANGKIVVYNEDFVSYGVTVDYRARGAAEASRVGAVAALVRSVTPFSLNNPHTGSQSYADDVPKIPVACITVEDAHLLQRLQDRGETLRILLKMDDEVLPNRVSRNTVVDLEGATNPDQFVIVSGHMDSWDVGQGALDDGGGVFISWGALVLLKNLGLRPKRTIRAVFWTSEETGTYGAIGYKSAHANDDLLFLMESDIGTFTPKGLTYTAGPLGSCILEEILQLLAPINATGGVKSSDVGSDIGFWIDEGYPGASLDTDHERYFWYHHSPADTMEILDSSDLDKNTALWASVAYVIADLSLDFPRN